MAEYGPSEAAVEAAAKGMVDAARVGLPSITAWEEMAEGPKQANRTEARGALAAAHDPAAGLDRSVCLRDVVELLRKHANPITGSVYGAPDLVQRVFVQSVVAESSSPDREGVPRDA